MAGTLALCLFANASAATFVWTGAGASTNLNVATNWSPNGVPASAAGNIGQFDGTAAGNLLLGTSGPSAGTNPWSVQVTAGQDSSLTIDPPSSTTNFVRLYDITIDAGAFETSGAAFSLGNGGGTPWVYLGNATAPYTNNSFTNNSAATALIQSDIRFGNGSSSSRILTFNGTGNWNVTAPLGINVTNVTGSLGIVKSGAGALTLAATNTFSDGLVLNEGTLNVNSATALGAAASTFTIAGAVTLDNTSGSAKTISNNNPQVWNSDFTFGTEAGTTLNDLGLGNGAVSLGTAAGTSRTVTTRGSAVLSVGGVVADGTTVTRIIKEGAGGLKFDGNNTYSGGTTLAAGFLHIGNNSALGAGSVTVTGGGFVPRIQGRTIANPISLAAEFIIGQPLVGNQMNFSGTIDLGGVNRTVTVADTTQALDSTISGVISNGGLTKSGGGTLILSAANTFAGPTTVSQGTLTLNNPTPLDSSSSVTINGTGAKLILSGSGTLAQPVTLTQGTIDGNGSINTLTVADGIANTVAAGNGQQSALSVGTLTFQGAASLNLTKDGPFGGQQLYVTDLATSSSADVVVTVASSTGVWQDNVDYSLIEFTNYPSAPDASHFTLVPPVGLNPSQQASLVRTETGLVLRITTNAILWTGSTNSNWLVGGPTNWLKNDEAIAYSDTEAVLFDDTSGVFGVNITGSVGPLAAIFTNDFNDYTVTSTGAVGIASGSLTKNGFAKVTIANTNSYTGATVITGGTLEVSGSIASSSTLAVANNAKLVFDLAGPSNVYSSPITGGGAVVKNGNGSLTLSGASTVTGGFTLNAGTLNINSPSALGGGSGVVEINGGILDNTSGGAIATTSNKPQAWNGDFNFTGTGNLDMGTGNVTLGGGGDRIVTVGGAGDILTVGEIKSGTQGLTLTGGGTLVATSIGSFGDASKIGGTLTVNGGTTLQINRSNGNSLTTTGDFVAAGLAGTGTITSGATATERSLQINNAVDNTFGGTIADGSTAALALNKQGVGTLTLTGTSSYTGPTVVGGGIINVRSNNALGNSRVRILAQGAGLQLQGGISLPATVTYLTSNDGTGVGGTGYAIANVSGDNTINGVITMTSGAGGTRIQSDSGSLTLAGNITNDQARTLTLHGVSTGANTVSGVIINGTGVNSLTKAGSGLWILTGSNTYTGVTTISEGTLQLGNGTTDGTIAMSSSVVNNASLVYNWAASHTAGYVISGTGSVTKNGAGTATLTGVNTYTGTTTVNAGELAVTGNSIADTGTVVINAGKVNLTGSETVDKLFFGGVQQPAGTYTAAGDGIHFSGAGSLIVTTGSGGPSGFGTWASNNGATGQSPSDDHDNDGVPNGVEFFVGATGSGFTALPSVVSNAGVRTITWPKSAAFTGAYEVQVSSDLGSWTSAPGGSVVDNGTSVVFTFPSGPSVRFARLVVKPS
ncbi:hypothetical protein GCM10023212_36250 [Luteolibacter yonseiensis]